MKPPEHISYSQLSLYEHCPRCYLLRYHVGVKTKTAPQLIFGKAVHDAIERYHLHGSIPDNLDRQVRAAVLTYTDRFPASYLDQVELGGDYPLWFKDPESGETLQRPFKFFIDGVHLHGVEHIAEHKTAAAPWTQERANTEMQPTLYSYAFREMFGRKEAFIQYNIINKPKYGGKYWLQTIRTTRDTSDYANFYWWAKNILDKMEADIFPKNHKVSWKCDLCKVCEK